jgi:hypothetical protein
MLDKGNASLTVNGVKHRLALVLQNASKGPNIGIAISEMSDLMTQHRSIQMTPPDASVDDGQVIFFKYQGKYLVLTGRNKIKHGAPDMEIVKGRLLSTVGLKNARWQEAVVAAPVVPATPVRSYDSAFANRPRFETKDNGRSGTDSLPSRSAVNNPNHVSRSKSERY